jgi:hypothetical protein
VLKIIRIKISGDLYTGIIEILGNSWYYSVPEILPFLMLSETLSNIYSV